MYGVNYQQAANMVLVEYLHKKEMIFKRKFKVWNAYASPVKIMGGL